MYHGSTASKFYPFTVFLVFRFFHHNSIFGLCHRSLRGQYWSSVYLVSAPCLSVSENSPFHRNSRIWGKWAEQKINRSQDNEKPKISEDEATIEQIRPNRRIRVANIVITHKDIIRIAENGRRAKKRKIRKTTKPLNLKVKQNREAKHEVFLFCGI